MTNTEIWHGWKVDIIDVPHEINEMNVMLFAQISINDF